MVDPENWGRVPQIVVRDLLRDIIDRACDNLNDPGNEHDTLEEIVTLASRALRELGYLRKEKHYELARRRDRGACTSDS